MSNRAQLSLLIDDDELYKQFITPCKSSRTLNGIIVRCLSAYYYNQEVRSMIEGVSITSDTDSSASQTTQDICDSIRNTLAMQSFLASELKNTLDAGTEDIGDILKRTNEVAYGTDFAKDFAEKTGTSVLQLEVKSSNTDDANQMLARTYEEQDIRRVLNNLVLAVEKMAETSNNSEVIGILHASSVPVHEEISRDTSEIPSLTTNSEVAYDTAKNEEVSVVETVEQKEFFDEEEVVPVESDFAGGSSLESEPEDATSAIDDLLDSLF